MRDRGTLSRPSESITAPANTETRLTTEQAAAHCGLLPKVFSQWVKAGLIPPTGWSKTQIDAVFDRLMTRGIERPPSTKQSSFDVPNVHRVPRRNSLEIVRHHYYRRGMKGSLLGKPGSAEFMRSLIDRERQLALRKSGETDDSSDQPTEPPQAISSPSIVHEPKPVSSSAIQANEPLAPSAGQLLTVDQLVARYKGRIAEGTWRNHRSRGTGPPYIKIFREIFYPLRWLVEWERQNMVWCDINERDDDVE